MAQPVDFAQAAEQAAEALAAGTALDQNALNYAAGCATRAAIDSGDEVALKATVFAAAGDYKNLLLLIVGASFQDDGASSSATTTNDPLATVFAAPPTATQPTAPPASAAPPAATSTTTSTPARTATGRRAPRQTGNN